MSVAVVEWNLYLLCEGADELAVGITAFCRAQVRNDDDAPEGVRGAARMHGYLCACHAPPPLRQEFLVKATPWLKIIAGVISIAAKVPPRVAERRVADASVHCFRAELGGINLPDVFAGIADSAVPNGLINDAVSGAALAGDFDMAVTFDTGMDALDSGASAKDELESILGLQGPICDGAIDALAALLAALCSPMRYDASRVRPAGDMHPRMRLSRI